MLFSLFLIPHKLLRFWNTTLFWQFMHHLILVPKILYSRKNCQCFCLLRKIHLTNFQNICFILAFKRERKEQILKHLIQPLGRDTLCLTTHRIIPVGNDAVLCCLDFFGVVNHFVQCFSWFCILNKLMLQNQIKKMSNSLIPVTYHKRYLQDK